MKTISNAEKFELEEACFNNADWPEWLIDFAYTQWADSIPYGYQTGDDGTVDEWLSDHIDWVINAFDLDEPAVEAKEIRETLYKK